jgi:hypothetical protein
MSKAIMIQGGENHEKRLKLAMKIWNSGDYYILTGNNNEIKDAVKTFNKMHLSKKYLKINNKAFDTLSNLFYVSKIFKNIEVKSIVIVASRQHSAEMKNYAPYFFRDDFSFYSGTLPSENKKNRLEVFVKRNIAKIYGFSENIFNLALKIYKIALLKIK